MKNKTLFWVLLVGLLVKSFMAFTTELNNDEVYYWTYAQKLQWNYFDHPPGIAVLLKIFTLNGWLQGEFFLRLGSMVCCIISTWLVYLIGKKIKNETAGLVAALLFTASPYCSMIAGWLVIPDAPQLVFWLVSVLLMLKITDTTKHNRKKGQQLLYLGVTSGFCILCKVHGIFLWVGFLAYIVFFQRRLLGNSYIFYAGFVSAAIISPVFLWNLSNNFISYRYHSERVSFFSKLQPDSFFRELGGEVLYNNPIVFILVVVAVVAVIKRKSFITTHHQRLLLCLSVPMILLVLFMAAFRDTLPHWTGPAYTTLIPLAAAYLVNLQPLKGIRIIPPVAKWAIGFTVVLLVSAFSGVKTFPGIIGKKDWQHLGDGDPLLDMSGFREFGRQFGLLYQKDLKQHKITKYAFLLSDFWFPAAHIDYYVAKPNHLNFLAIGELSSIHNYAWLNTTVPPMETGTDAYFITISNNFHPVPDYLVRTFTQVLPPVLISQHRAGTIVRHFIIYRLIGYKGLLPANGVVE